MKLAPSFLSLLTVLAPLVLLGKAEENALEKRAVYTTCDTWGTSTQGNFIVYQNLWGASAATSGSQCLSLDSVSGSTFAWSTTWTWAGGPYNVKSYDNIAYNIATGIKVSTISSIPTTWVWSQTATGTPVNDVAYDLMTTATSDVSGTHAYEIMVWLGAYGGAGPISSSGSPVSTPTISGYSWKLYDGYNGSMRVFSFVATTTVTSYTGDLNDFLKYLATNNGFPSTSQYLSVLQAGTEPFIGTSVKLTTTKYTVAVNTGAAATTTSSTKTSSSSTKVSTSTKSTSTSKTSTAASSGTAPIYGQCGGANWTGPTTCASGTCTFSNTYYSQCIP